MKLVFIYGPPASGKYTIARKLADETGLPLFHNHLVVDAVASVFPFGHREFIRLREQFWMDTFRAAVASDRSLIFTFQPEASVPADFAVRVQALVTQAGGDVIFVRLKLALSEQLDRVSNPDRAKFGKLRDQKLLEHLHEQFVACEAAMPAPRLTIDTALTSPQGAATRILALL